MINLVVNSSDVLAMQLARELSEKYACRCNIIGNGDEASPGEIRIVSMKRPEGGIGGVLIGKDFIVANPISIGLPPDSVVVVIETGRSKPRKERRPHGEVLELLGTHLGLQARCQAA